jgi:hypothetical protein
MPTARSNSYLDCHALLQMLCEIVEAREWWLLISEKPQPPYEVRALETAWHSRHAEPDR